jgi:hypothetical protein
MAMGALNFKPDPLMHSEKTYGSDAGFRDVLADIGLPHVDVRLTLRCCASALLFFQWRIGFIRRRLRFGALGFAQRGFLVFLSLFLLAPSTCCPRSLGSISSVIWLKCHCVSRWLITHLSALYKHVAMPLKRHVCASNYNDKDNRDRMCKKRRGRR